MDLEILKIAATQGIWAMLSIILIFYILRNQEKRDTAQESRELKYQEIISILCNKLSTIEDIKKDIIEIKNKII